MVNHFMPPPARPTHLSLIISLCCSADVSLGPINMYFMSFHQSSFNFELTVNSRGCIVAKDAFVCLNINI